MLLEILEHHNLPKTKCIDLIIEIFPVVNNLDSETWILGYKYILSKLRFL